MPTKSANNALDLTYINFDASNNRIDFTLPISSNAETIGGEDSWVREQTNAAFLQANSAFSSANNVDLTPAFEQANAAFEAANNATDPWVRTQANLAFEKANSAAVYSANTNSTGFLSIPIGTTAERPTNPANGAIRVNTTLSTLEVYLNGYWANIASSVYRANYIVVGGGGGASGGVSGVNYGAGGAGGSVNVGVLELSPGVSYTVRVGAGGTGGGSNGSSSNIVQSISQTTLVNSGGGEGPAAPSFTGGRNDLYSGGGPQGGVNAGGGAGGGGSTSTGNGGPGYVWSFNNTAYASGGGGGQGGSRGSPDSGFGAGSGGGAPGRDAGTPNTAGGSGVVIIVYQGSQRGSGGTITSNGGFTFHTFTGSGTFIA